MCRISMGCYCSNQIGFTGVYTILGSEYTRIYYIVNTIIQLKGTIHIIHTITLGVARDGQ